MNLPSMALVHKLEELLKDARPYNPENVEKLEELREQMLQAGFNAPFKGIMQRSMDEAKDLDESEWADLKKQISYFRQIANLKKYGLARASVALSAHRLSENFLRMGYSDIVEHSPLDGNHINLLMDSGNEGIMAYRTLMDRFEMMAELSNCFSVKVRYKGETHNVQVEDKERIDFKVARMFGIEAEVLDVKSATRKRPIIASKGTRVSLVSAVVNYVSLDIREKLKAEEGGKLKEYNDFLRGKGLLPDVLVDRVEGHEELKEDMCAKG
jgi:Zn-finger domain-containing protein